MASENKHIIIGYLGSDPEVRYADGTRGQQKVAMLSVGTTEKYKDSNGDYQTITDWHRCVAWRQSADFIERFVRKGSMVYITGKVRTRDYQDRDTGKKVYITETIVDSIQVLDRRQDSEDRNQANTQQTRRRPSNTSTQKPQISGELPDDDDDDLPIG